MTIKATEIAKKHEANIISPHPSVRNIVSQSTQKKRNTTSQNSQIPSSNSNANLRYHQELNETAVLRLGTQSSEEKKRDQLVDKSILNILTIPKFVKEAD